MDALSVQHLDAVARLGAGPVRLAVVGARGAALALALAFCRRRGIEAVAVDAVDAAEARPGRRGQSPRVNRRALAEAVGAGRLSATADLGVIPGCGAVVMLPPAASPASAAGMARAVAPQLRVGHVVVVQSTAHPGTTEDVVLPLLERGSGLAAGRDFHLACWAGQAGAAPPARRLATVVGGHTDRCRDAAIALYRRAFRQVLPVSSARAAEIIARRLSRLAGTLEAGAPA